MTSNDYDVVIIGGGFYGCCLALFLRSVTPRLLVVEAGTGLLERASRVNQARIHTGFHYPRSFTTAMRSRALQERFTRDFKHAVVDDFDMLYAIAAYRSKVSASRFARMFEAIGAPFSRAPKQLRLLFDSELIEDVFVCREFAFDWTALRDDLQARLAANGVPVRMGETVETTLCESNRVIVRLRGGQELTTSFAVQRHICQYQQLGSSQRTCAARVEARAGGGGSRRAAAGACPAGSHRHGRPLLLVDALSDGEALFAGACALHAALQLGQFVEEPVFLSNQRSPAEGIALAAHGSGCKAFPAVHAGRHVPAFPVRCEDGARQE